MWYTSAVLSVEEEASNCSTYLILKNDISWDTTFSLHFFVCYLKMNCILSLLTKKVLSHGCFFLVIVMTTTNSTTQCLDYVSTTWTDTVLYVYTKKEGDWSCLCFLCRVNNDCETSIKLFYILICVSWDFVLSFPEQEQSERCSKYALLKATAWGEIKPAAQPARHFKSGTIYDEVFV